MSDDGYVDAGLDVKLGITESLFADFTLNTDFAQAEADEEQVNLTRFNLSFPEKREFFLEGQGVYQFAIESSSGGRGGGYEPMLFFSRRVRLVSGQAVPIQFGVLVTGKVGSFDVGAMSIQSGAHDALGIGSTNFTVLRLRRDVFERGSVGTLFARRSSSLVADGSNETLGVDANLSFLSDFYLSGYYAETRTAGLKDDDQS